MPIKYRYDSISNVVYTYGIGEVIPGELEEYFQKILRDSEIKNGFWEIVNTKNVTNVTVTFSDCIKLLPLIRRFVKEKNYKGAILYAPNKHSVSIIQLWFTILRKFISEKFFIENQLESFKKVVLQHIGITYELDAWHQNKFT